MAQQMQAGAIVDPYRQPGRKTAGEPPAAPVSAALVFGFTLMVLGAIRVSLAVVTGRARDEEAVAAMLLVVVGAWAATRRGRRRARMWLRTRRALHDEARARKRP
jgi:hypothetical protein